MRARFIERDVFSFGARCGVRQEKTNDIHRRQVVNSTCPWRIVNSGRKATQGVVC
jgi:hypothetical protein